jgi:predicted hydrolase (HD superfamily)
LRAIRVLAGEDADAIDAVSAHWLDGGPRGARVEAELDYQALDELNGLLPAARLLICPAAIVV